MVQGGPCTRPSCSLRCGLETRFPKNCYAHFQQVFDKMFRFLLSRRLTGLFMLDFRPFENAIFIDFSEEEHPPLIHVTCGRSENIQSTFLQRKFWCKSYRGRIILQRWGSISWWENSKSRKKTWKAWSFKKAEENYSSLSKEAVFCIKWLRRLQEPCFRWDVAHWQLIMYGLCLDSVFSAENFLQNFWLWIGDRPYVRIAWVWVVIP